MKYIENEFVELISSLTDELKYEIVAFLNSYLGNIICFSNLNYKFNEIDFNFLDDLNVHKEKPNEPIEVK